MIDSDDIVDAALYGPIALVIIFVVLYFVFSKPEIDKCHEQGGVMLKIEGEHKCIKKELLQEAKRKTP
jgi:hypothetical protein